MKEPVNLTDDEPTQPPPTRLEEARRIIEDYVSALREIAHKLRQRLH